MPGLLGRFLEWSGVNLDPLELASLEVVYLEKCGRSKITNGLDLVVSVQV